MFVFLRQTAVFATSTMMALWGALAATVGSLVASPVRSIPRGAAAARPLIEQEDELSRLVSRMAEVCQDLVQAAASDSEPFTPLERLNSVAASSVYSPLKSTGIRLVRVLPGSADAPIECSVFEIEDKSSAQAYTALSYVWGSQANPKTINLNGHPWLVTRNLESALLQLRSPHEPITLWIDAMAINQIDILERNQQVSIMREIYAGAEKTILSLDPDGSEVVSLFLDIADLLNSQPDLIARLQPEILPPWLNVAVTKVGGLSYWERVWVTQEVMYSHHLAIIHQSRELPYDALTGSWKLIGDRIRSEIPSVEAEPQKLKMVELGSFMRTFGPVTLPQPGIAFTGEYITMDAWMESIQHKKSTDPRDIVFGYHGCFPPNIRDRIEVDYSEPADQVWAAMTAIAVEHTGRLDLILGHHSYERTQPNLPSWVPQWSAISKTNLRAGTGFRYLKAYTAGGNIPARCKFVGSGRILQAEGVEIGVVDVVPQPGFKPARIGDRSAMFAWLKDIEAGEIDEYFHRLRREFGIAPAAGTNATNFVDAFSAGNDTSEWQVEDGLAERGHLIPDRRRGMTIMVHHFGRKMFSYRTAWNSERNGDVGFALGPGTRSPGDKICVLLGCSVPVAIRQVGQHYELLGDVHVPSCMGGEAVEGIDEGKTKLAQFLIQ